MSPAVLPSTKRANDLESRFPRFSFQKPLQLPNIPGEKFSPYNCFVPGWKGDSLRSVKSFELEKMLAVLVSDIKSELLKTHKNFTKNTSTEIYDEFLAYCKSLGLRCDQLDSRMRFWAAMTPEYLEINEELNRFVDLFANRVAAVLFHKLRFISSLVSKSQLSDSELNKALLYPTSFFAQTFKKGTQTELPCKALEPNLYSWYQPHERMLAYLKNLKRLASELEVPEISKNISNRTQVVGENQNVYSHALSHVGTGLFLNSLQVNFPMWMDLLEGKQLSSGAESEQIISCKYFGDYTEALSLSHWLAQENNKNFRWDEMLCPDFKGCEFVSGTFTKICNELQFLTFLSDKAVGQGSEAIRYICRIMGGHFRNRKNTTLSQQFVFLENPEDSTYDRIVLNLCHFPKNNPQHHLMASISEQVKYLKNGGYLFVLSSKKLFVPSLSDRLVPVLAELKTEAIFDLDNVKGKGELGSNIYVFRKKQIGEPERQFCSYFRISADLQNFQQFAGITDHLRSFYLSHLNELPTLEHKEFDDSFRIEYFQEAIVNGLLIHSSSDDSSRITHPAFFKGMLENCVPMESLFEIKVIAGDRPQVDKELLPGLKRDISYFMVVDFRTPSVNLELHPMDTFRSIHSDYGQTLCCYFQLIPKLQGLNPNVLRTYFKTIVGQQVANLTFSGGLNLVKGALSRMLIPKFLTQTEPLPAHFAASFRVIELTEEQLMESTPESVAKSFTHLEMISRDLLGRYACDILSRFSTFERTLENIIWKLDDQRLGNRISFSNPVILEQLKSKKLHSLLPKNPDVYLDFTGNANNIHLTLTDCRLHVTHEGDLKQYSVELISGNQVVLRMHAEESMALFVNSLFSEYKGYPVSQLIRGIQVPSLADLNSVLTTSESFKSVYSSLLDRVRLCMKDAFRLQVAIKRN